MSHADMVKRSRPLQEAVTAVAAHPQARRRRRHRLRARRRLRARAGRRRPHRRRRRRRSASPRCCSASSPAPAAPSGSRGWSGRAGPRTSSSPAASSRPTRRWRSAWSTDSSPPTRSTTRRVAWARQFTGAATYAVRAAKECIDRGLEVDLDTGLEIERQQFAGALRHGGPRRIGMRSFVENGPGKAVFEGR